MLRSEDTLMRSGLLEQEGIGAQETKIGRCWNTITQVNGKRTGFYIVIFYSTWATKPLYTICLFHPSLCFLYACVFNLTCTHIQILPDGLFRLFSIQPPQLNRPAEVINFACFGLCGKKLFIVLVSFAQVTMMTNALRVVRITFLMLELHHSDGDKL